MDVGVILGGMILKHITNPNKQNRLLEMIDMRHIENEIGKLVYDEYGDILDAKDKEIEEKNKKLENLNQTNKKYKENIKKLSKIKDLNSPKAKELINSLTLLWDDILSSHYQFLISIQNTLPPLKKNN